MFYDAVSPPRGLLEAPVLKVGWGELGAATRAEYVRAAEVVLSDLQAGIADDVSKVMGGLVEHSQALRAHLHQIAQTSDAGALAGQDPRRARELLGEVNKLARAGTALPATFDINAWAGSGP
jgi:hypothetical protein